MPHYSLRSCFCLWNFAAYLFTAPSADVLFSAPSHKELWFVWCQTHIQLLISYLFHFCRIPESVWWRRRRQAINPGVCPSSTPHQRDLRLLSSTQTPGKSWRTGWMPFTSTSMIRVSVLFVWTRYTVDYLDVSIKAFMCVLQSYKEKLECIYQSGQVAMHIFS